MTAVRVVRTASVPIDAEVRPPGSKSLTIRALTAAALAPGRSLLYGPLEADDSLAMVGCLRALGAGVATGADPWVVDGTAGRLNQPSSPLDAGESALSARILTVMAALADGTITITGHQSLARRPMAPLADSLRRLGVGVETEGAIPVVVRGRGGLTGGTVSVECSVSSQFATAHLLAAPIADSPSEIVVSGLAGSRGYLDLTTMIMGEFGARVEPTITGFSVVNGGYRAATVVIEPDASAAVYPMLAAAITGGRVEILGLGESSAQPDAAFGGILASMGAQVAVTGTGIEVIGSGGPLHPFSGDLSASPDAALAVGVACLFADGTSRLSGLGSLRHKESDRLDALAAGLTELGAGAEVSADTITITPGALRGGHIDPHGDHRIAMAFGTAGLVIEGVEVADPGVVAKTWPGYWEMLEALA